MVSVICPVLNEVKFIRAWCENVTKFSDDIHVFDCGSTDGTLEILREYPIHIYHNDKWAESIERPYLWQEGQIRNELINHCKNDWVVNLDADELLGEDFRESLPSLCASHEKFIRLLQYPFWYSPNLLRAKQWRKDWWLRFYPSYQVRMFRNEPAIRYRQSGNHAPLQWRGIGRLSVRLLSKTVKIPFYHYHFIFRKENGNRENEINQSDERLVTYFGRHPEETKFYDWFQSRQIEIPAGENQGVRSMAVNTDDRPYVGEAERDSLMDDPLYVGAAFHHGLD